MKSLIAQISECIEHIIDKKIGGTEADPEIIVFPCGDVGMQVVEIMKNIYDIEPTCLIDNYKCNYSRIIYPITDLKSKISEKSIVFLASTNVSIYKELKQRILTYISEDRIVELESMRALFSDKYSEETICNKIIKTEIGKYSYGPLCHDNALIESIGAFCSFAPGVQYVVNHEMNYITTHRIIQGSEWVEGYYMTDKELTRDIEGLMIKPKTEMIKAQKRARIGNDVWLGRNVLVTNGANIGNGVIAGAGAVITKDVPDYAIVGGVPAKIIRYRYTSEQIEALNSIQWWNWSDKEIRDRFEDFYLPIEKFIDKYLTK